MFGFKKPELTRSFGYSHLDPVAQTPKTLSYTLTLHATRYSLPAMASLKLLLSQARRHCFTNHPSHVHSPLSHSFFSQTRSFSSSESNPSTTPFEPIPIQPVSYPVKPQDPPPPEPQSSSDAPSLSQPSPPPPKSADGPEPPRAWTREDIRYVKDAPSITPVSYPVRVAPLPDDKGPAENDEMEKERRRIEAEDQLRKKMLKASEDEKLKVPFPLLIKPKQKEKPPLFDLSEAIRQVKVRQENVILLISNLLSFFHFLLN